MIGVGNRGRYSNLRTPFYMIEVKKIDELVSDMQQSLKKYWENGIIGYSFKTNNLPWIIEYMKGKGLYAETVSADEYSLALKMGYCPENIIFNGPVKDYETFIYAVKNGSIVNIDSKRELRWLEDLSVDELKNSKLGIRVNYCIEEDCPGESQCGDEDGRFGFSYETGEFEKALDYFKILGVNIAGIHLHCSSKTRSINIYKSIANRACEIIKKYNLKIDYIDVGGGFFGGMPDKPTFTEYFNEIHNIVCVYNDIKDIDLIVEPGMSLIGPSVDYVATVIDVKDTKNNSFAITDGSRIHIDPFMRKQSYSYFIEGAEGDNSFSCEKMIICGFTCMEGDRFFSVNRKLKENDRIVFQKVGAYTMGLSPQFIEFYPSVYVNDGDKVFEARRKNTAADFITTNYIK